MVDWEIKDGLLTGLGLHDGYFLGAIANANSNVVTIKVQSVTKALYNIELIDVSHLNIQDFWNGSIIGEVFFLPKKQVPSYMWRNLYSGQLRKEDTDKEILKFVSKIENQHLFALECSYGAQVYATCDQLRIYRG